jgi:hypothetical protein
LRRDIGDTAAGGDGIVIVTFSLIERMPRG